MARRPHPATTNQRRWRAIRLLILQRDGYRCRSCGAARMLEIDHIIPIHLGGDWWNLEGLQCLCAACHWDKSRIDTCGPNPERDEWRSWMKRVASQ